MSNRAFERAPAYARSESNSVVNIVKRSGDSFL
jgi:hypothetical protein